MKRWLLTFSAVLCAGVVLLMVFQRQHEEERVVSEQRAKWKQEAAECVRNMEEARYRTGDSRARSMALHYSIARRLLDSAPPGVDVSDFKSEVDVMRLAMKEAAIK